MRFGFHISISGGFESVVEKALYLGCETLQVFTASNKQWKRTPIDPDEARCFHESVRRAGLHPLVVHLFYLPNLATPDEDLFLRSKQAFATELERSALLGADFLVFHPGAFKNSSPREGIKRVIQALDFAISAAGENGVRLLVENTSGSGTRLGRSFEELALILDGVGNKDSVGICLDTAHAFEAGYPLHDEEGLEKTIQTLDRQVGLERLCLLHLNDSKTEFASRNDRHWHIGEGEMGLAAFRRIINHLRLKHLPAIMETPTSDEEDIRNMSTVKRLREEV